MKRVALIVAAAVLCAGAAAAQEDAGIQFGAWCRNIFSPIGYNGEDMITQGPQTSWAGQYRVGMVMKGVSEHFGFEANPDFSDAGAGTHDMDYVWCKPFDFLRIDIGQVRDETLKKSATWGMWDMVRLGTQKDASLIFTMLANSDYSQNIPNGIIFKIDPMEALHIGVFLGAKDGYGSQQFSDTYMHYSAISAGYKLEGIGKIMLGVWGQETGTDNDPTGGKAEDKFWCRIDGAFNLTMIENLDASIGVRIPTGFVYAKSGKNYVAGTPNTTEPFQINLAGNYNLMDNFVLHALIATNIYQYSFVGNSGKFADGTVFAARLGVGADYGLTEDLTLLADFRFATKEWNRTELLKDKKNDSATNFNPAIGFMVGLKKSFSNGNLTIGFEGALNDTFKNMDDVAYGCGGNNGDPADPDTFKFLVPIVLFFAL